METTMKPTFRTALLATLFCCVLPFDAHASATTYSDHNALEGMKSAKTLFDINLTEAKKLELYLNVIKQTHADLVRQGLTPKIVIAFRGASVRLVSTETWSFTEDDQQSLERSAKLLKELAALGIRLEACSIATNLFKVDNSTLLPGIEVVGNTFISLTGYQSKGYALIPIQ